MTEGELEEESREGRRVGEPEMTAEKDAEKDRDGEGRGEFDTEVEALRESGERAVPKLEPEAVGKEVAEECKGEIVDSRPVGEGRKGDWEGWGGGGVGEKVLYARDRVLKGLAEEVLEVSKLSVGPDND